MRPFFVVLGGAVLVYIVVFWRLGDASFWDPDEAHYAETTRELIATGDWLVPTYNDEPFFDKPIFFHWLQSVPMRILGPTEGAARAVPALAALALIGITWWLGIQLAGPAVGVLAALLLATNPGIFGLARYAILDSVFTALLFGGASLVAFSALRAHPRFQYAGYALIAFATCVKGPIAIALSGLAFLIAILFSSEARARLLSLRWTAGLLIVLVIAAPWSVLMLRRFNGAFVEGYILNENIRLFSQSMYTDQPGWWFYLAIIATGFLPWTWLIVGRLYDQARAAIVYRRSPDVVDTLLWSWVIAILGFFSFSRFKLDHYIFPVAPALCIVCARAWSEQRVPRPDDHSTTGARLGARLIGPTLVVAGIVMAILATHFLALPVTFSIIPLLIIALGTVASVRYWTRPERMPALPSLALTAMGVLYIGILVWIIPHIEREKVIPSIARWVGGHATANDRIASFRLNRWNPAYRFYVNRHVLMVESDEEARQFFLESSPYYCVMTAHTSEALRRAGVPLKIVYRGEGLWVTSGNRLWRERDALTTFVVTTHADQTVPP